jgi:hypothetical protein
MKNILFVFCILFPTITKSQDQQLPKEIELVFDYLMKKEYPEVFGSANYSIRPIGWQIIDINDDGKTEIFLQTFPHYRQSPTITIFQIEKSDSVIRILEGFAPGHLIPLSKEDDYLDPHSTATAIDMQLNSGADIKKFAESSLKFGMSVVLYKNFIHEDKRNGKGIFIDLTYLDDFSSENSCANFQFSTPDQIIAGSIKDHENKFFIARVRNELFCYEIIGFEGTSFINKKISIVKIPKDFKRLVLDAGLIKYENNKGKILSLEI